jgi:hypothetical protein
MSDANVGPDVPQELPGYAEQIVTRLAEANLFLFSASAREQLDSFFARESRVAPLALEQSRALSYLHAAEYALLPAFMQPGYLPVTAAGPVAVSSDSVRLALLKGNCSLIIWTHAPAGYGVGPLSAADLTVFSGDASKLEHLLPGAPISSDVITEYVRALEAAHAQSGWAAATQVAESGVIRLQGTLWQLKSAVTEHVTREDFNLAITRLLLRAGRDHAGRWRAGVAEAGQGCALGENLALVHVALVRDLARVQAGRAGQQEEALDAGGGPRRRERAPTTTGRCGPRRRGRTCRSPA